MSYIDSKEYEDHCKYTSQIYLVGTPIGNLADITLRALETLKIVDTIFCEDTRVSKKLLMHYGISKSLISLNEHNFKGRIPKIHELLGQGKKIAFISDAGMPGISDPGAELISLARQESYTYTVIPGPSAPITAFALAGIMGTNFYFGGFFPQKKKDVQAQMERFAGQNDTVIYFEAPHRLLKTIEILTPFLGDGEFYVTRELTKKFEEVRLGSCQAHQEHFTQKKPLGEFVLVIPPNAFKVADDTGSWQDSLKKLLKTHRTKDACEIIVQNYDVSKQQVYKYALSLKEES